MRIVTEETHRLERIIGDLLDLARLEGGGTSMRRERVDVERDLHARRASATSASCASAVFASFVASSRAPNTSSAIRTVSSRRCRTWPPTRCGTHPKEARSS